MTNLTSSIQVSEALDAIRMGMEFAYKQGLHEFGSDPVETVETALAMRSKDHSINREKLAIELHHASCANVPRHNPDYDRAHLPWEGVPPTGKQSWLAIADTAIALLAPPITVDDVERVKWHTPTMLRWLAENINAPRLPDGTLTGRFLYAVAENIEARTLSTGGKK